MSTNYTPAPWNKTQNIVQDANGKEIATISRYQDGYVQANAHLIAAAPELLEALQDCYAELNQLAFLSGDKLSKITLNKALAAISKATAES